MGSRCTYAGAPRAPIEHRCTCKPQLRRRLGAKLGAPTQVHLDASPPGGSCWNANATAPIGAPAVAGCMRAWIYVWKVYACKYLHLRRCRWTFFGFPCWGEQVQLHSTTVGLSLSRQANSKFWTVVSLIVVIGKVRLCRQRPYVRMQTCDIRTYRSPSHS